MVLQGLSNVTGSWPRTRARRLERKHLARVGGAKHNHAFTATAVPQCVAVLLADSRPPPLLFALLFSFGFACAVGAAGAPVFAR